MSKAFQKVIDLVGSDDWRQRSVVVVVVLDTIGIETVRFWLLRFGLRLGLLQISPEYEMT